MCFFSKENRIFCAYCTKWSSKFWHIQKEILMGFEQENAQNSNSIPRPSGFQRKVNENLQELVEFRPDLNVRIWQNQETESYSPHWHSHLEIIMPVENHYGVKIKEETFDCIRCCTQRLKEQYNTHCSAQLKRVTLVIFFYKDTNRCIYFFISQGHPSFAYN